MSTTVNNIYNLAMTLIDEKQIDGTISATTDDEYLYRSYDILWSLQNELMKDGDLYSEHQITRVSIQPSIGSFARKEHNSDDVIEESSKVTRAYYFEINGPGTVYIEDYNGSWNVLDTITVPSTVDTDTSYSGIVTPTSGASKSRIRFSGDYYYTYLNYALFEESFPDSDRIPVYRPWIKYEMPSNFKSIDRMISEYYPEQYTRNADYKWEARKDLYLCYEFTGNIRLIYKPVPVQLTALTDTIEIDDITATTVLANGLAANLLATENPDLANYFMQRYAELKIELLRKPPQAENQIVSVYASSDAGRLVNGGDW